MERERKKVMRAKKATTRCFGHLMTSMKSWSLDSLSYSLVSPHPTTPTSSPPPSSLHVSIPLQTPTWAALDFAKSVQEIEKKVANGLLEKAKSVCTSRGIIAETVLEEGDAKVAICDAVSKYNISMLVMAEQHIGIVKG